MGEMGVGDVKTKIYESHGMYVCTKTEFTYL